MRRAEELLYDSEASFRLVDHAIEELNASAELDREATGLLAHVMAQPDGFAGMLEGAGVEILDGLDRAAHLVEQLDGATTLSDVERRRVANALREQLSTVVNHLQFQDITGQQLEHVGNVLVDLHRRLQAARGLQ